MSRLFLLVFLGLSGCAGVYVGVPIGPVDVGVTSHTGTSAQEAGSHGRRGEEELYMEGEN
jgi:hypothetical protein